MTFSSLKWLRRIIILLAAPVLCLPAAISINGTCELGSCSSPDLLASGASIPSTPFSYDAVVNGDTFKVSGTYSAAYNANGSTSINFSPVVSLISTGGATSNNDLITVDLFQDYNLTPISGSYSASASITLSNDFGPGSYGEAELFYNGQSTGLIGPYTGVGTFNGSSSANLSGLSAPLAADFRFTFDFAAGSAVTPSVPEPSAAALLLLGGIAVVVPGFRRRKGKSLPV